MVVYSTDGLREDMIRPLISPDSIAVVGATGSAGKLGNMLMRSLLEFGFSGRIMPVNPRSDSVMGLRCFPDVRSAAAAAGSPPDSVYITVPPSKVLGCILDSVSAGAKSITVVASSIEFGGQGMPADTGELVGILHKSGTLLLGPNCLGIHNPLARVTFNQSLSSDAGNVVFLSQSGSMTEIFLLSMAARGIGTALAVSTGNEAMLTVSDFMLTAASMPGVNTVAAYVEEIRDPEKFIRACRALGPGRRVVVYKAGVTAVGRRAASSHTGAIAGTGEAYSALFRKAGVVQAGSYAELVDSVILASAGTPVRGKRAAVVSAPGGLCVSLSDALDRSGFTLPDFTAAQIERLKEAVPRGVAVRNPLDLTMAATADTALYSKCIRAISGGGFDVIVVGAPTSYSTSRFVEAMADASGSAEVPSVVVWTGDTGSVLKGIRDLGRLGIPAFTSPESAASSLSSAAGIRERLKRMAGYQQPSFAETRGGREVWLDQPEIAARLASAGISMPESLTAGTADEVLEGSGRIGYPLVAKLISPGLVHKSESGAVILNIRSRGELEDALRRLGGVAASLPSGSPFSYGISRQVEGGVELAIGSFRALGCSVIMFGLGGTLIELMGMKSYALCPVGREEARTMIEESGLRPLTEGYRGMSIDAGRLEEMIVAASRMLASNPSIAEMDMNPVVANVEGLWPVDVRMLCIR